MRSVLVSGILVWAITIVSCVASEVSTGPDHQQPDAGDDADGGGDGASELDALVEDGSDAMEPDGDRGLEPDGWRDDGEPPHYPLVLVHGMGNELYFGWIDYFHGVAEALEDAGYVVYTPVIPYVADSAVRAERLAEAVTDVLEETGAAKVHLIGHSQGGLDIRVLISGLGYADRVATATTIATPHRGIRTPIPAWLTGMDISEAHMTGAFAARYPDVPSVPSFAWAGATCLAVDLGCLADLGGEVVAPQLSSSYSAVRVAHLDDEYSGANDGAVPVASAAGWGELLGILPADHWDQIGHIPGQRVGPFDHIDFFLAEAARLRQLELDLGL